MPTSVLLAVLAAAGLLALAPALVRRYDATERLVAERAQSTARVIDRRRRQRTVPGRRPINPPRSASPPPPIPVSAPPVRRRPPRVRRHTPAIYRRRRVLAALVLLNTVELCGVGLVGPGFWIGSAPSLLLLGAYLVHLRRRAVLASLRRKEAARRAARIAARQAELRREQERRLAARREALRRAAAARAAAQRESVRLSQRYVDGSARGPVRGRAYEARAAGY